jgi:iron(III) transport system ATP-binding protein
LSRVVTVGVRQLVVRFGDKVILDRVDLAVAPGELFLLLGPSGSGKTTLLRVLAGFVTPDEGSVRFDGDDVTRLEPHRRNTGMVFQSFALFPHLTVGQNVAFGLRERRTSAAETTERVRHALDSVRMGDYEARRIDQLSGGEQQRVALARALVVRPRCLLLDEPLSNLDAKLRHSMRDEIRRVCKEFGLTTVYVTHDQKEALAIADRIAVMEGGRILQIGTPSDVYRRPSSRKVAAFVGDTNLLEGRVIAVSESELRVQTEVGELSAARAGGDGWAGRTPAAHGFAAGDAVWVSIRPECLSLRETPNGQSNVIRGVVQTSTYLGEIAEHHFASAATALKIYELNPPMSRSRQAATLATVAPSDVVVLPFDEAHA